MKAKAFLAGTLIVLATLGVVVSRMTRPNKVEPPASTTPVAVEAARPTGKPPPRGVSATNPAAAPGTAFVNKLTPEQEMDLGLSNFSPEIQRMLREHGIPPVPAPPEVPRIPIVWMVNGKPETTYAISVKLVGTNYLVQYSPRGEVFTNKTNGVLVFPAVALPKEYFQ